MYRLSAKSIENLNGVDSRLVAVVNRAIRTTAVDFMVFEGVRTKARQRRLLAKGRSWTMDSRHLTGHAVDLVAWVNGKLDFDTWEHYYAIADAVKQAAKEQDLLLVWGGCWDTVLTTSKLDAEELSRGYVNRRVAKDLRAAIDGPHFEISRLEG